MQAKEFQTYHPVVNLVYFVQVLGFGCFVMHPICLGISLLAAFWYSVLLKGKKQIKLNLCYLLPMILVMALLNPVWNHQGVSILTYLPSGNPLTLESILYGIAAAMMLGGVICWFSCYNAVMTTDKLLCLFGKLLPALSLMLSMIFRFVPRLIAQLKQVTEGQKLLGRDVTKGSLIKRAKYGLRIVSVLVTWSLENALDTADSMKARGYGLSGRTAFSIFRFEKRDGRMLLALLLLGGYVLTGILCGGVHFEYFPAISYGTMTAFSLSVYPAYACLCLVPVILELWEVRRWKSIKSTM